MSEATNLPHTGDHAEALETTETSAPEQPPGPEAGHEGNHEGNHEGKDGDWRKREVALALTNALKLGSSLILTWGIALVTRLYIPRFLGPERFGILNFADAFTATAFVIMGFGLDTYVRKEVSVRPDHASDFVGGIVALRAILLIFVYAGMAIVLHATHRPADVAIVVYLYGISQFFMMGSATSAGLLQAAGKVNSQSILSVAVKVLWAACTFLAIYLRLDLWAFALTVALTESVKSLVLFALARRLLKFKLQINVKATAAVIVASLPFFVSGLATTIYDRIGANLLTFLTNNSEVGWYGAAGGLAGLAMLLTPLVSWVLIPLLARAYVASKEEFYGIVRRSLEFVLCLSIPMALIMALGADFWVSLLFGEAFAPAAMALRVIAATTVLMYVSIVLFYALAVMNLTWRMTWAFVGGIVVNPTINFLLIRPLSERLGPGGGGFACSIATFCTEVSIVLPLTLLLGRHGYDRRLVTVILKSLGAVAVVTALHLAIASRLGPAVLVVDLLAYAALVLVTGAVDVAGVIAAAKSQLSARRKRQAA